MSCAVRAVGPDFRQEGEASVLPLAPFARHPEHFLPCCATRRAHARFLAQKTAVAVAYTKRGSGLIKLNGEHACSCALPSSRSAAQYPDTHPRDRDRQGSFLERRAAVSGGGAWWSSPLASAMRSPQPYTIRKGRRWFFHQHQGGAVAGHRRSRGNEQQWRRIQQLHHAADISLWAAACSGSVTRADSALALRRQAAN